MADPPFADTLNMLQLMTWLRDPNKPPQPMVGVKAPTSRRGVAWWKIAIATVNEGLRSGVFDLGTAGPKCENGVWHNWTMQGIPAWSRFTDAGFDEVRFYTALWWKPDDLRAPAPGQCDVSAQGWLERRDGKWLQASTSLFKGKIARRADLDALTFERPLGYQALGKLR